MSNALQEPFRWGDPDSRLCGRKDRHVLDFELRGTDVWRRFGEKPGPSHDGVGAIDGGVECFVLETLKNGAELDEFFFPSGVDLSGGTNGF